ncbi:MAG: hypothetical protein IPM02_24640 [Betaproteobacteria bacterium]|nr:hypothetical protein [Betaproteobacteria bacterium]
MTVARGRTLEQLVGERDRQLSAQHDRMQRFEALVGEREVRIVERDRQLSALARARQPWSGSSPSGNS